jgi:hypothetical protein
MHPVSLVVKQLLDSMGILIRSLVEVFYGECQDLN